MVKRAGFISLKKISYVLDRGQDQNDREKRYQKESYILVRVPLSSRNSQCGCEGLMQLCRQWSRWTAGRPRLQARGRVQARGEGHLAKSLEASSALRLVGQKCERASQSCRASPASWARPRPAKRPLRLRCGAPVPARGIDSL